MFKNKKHTRHYTTWTIPVTLWKRRDPKMEISYYNETLHNHSNSKINLWKQMACIIIPIITKTFVSINELIIDGKVTTCHKILSDVMNDYFGNVGSKLHCDIPERSGDYKKYLPRCLMHSFYLISVVREHNLKLNVSTQGKPLDMTLLGASYQAVSRNNFR